MNIDLNTIAFIDILNGLSKKLSNGVVPFSEYHGGHENVLVYDDSEVTDYLNDSGDIYTEYKIVASSCCGCDHHDIISFYEYGNGRSPYLEDLEVRLQVHESVDGDIDYSVVVKNVDGAADCIFDVFEDGWQFTL